MLRRVIGRDRGVWWAGGRATSRTSYSLPGTVLRTIVEPEELARPHDSAWPDTVILLARPEPDVIGKTPGGALLTLCWRRLFRARIRMALREAVESGALDRASIGERWRAIGSAESAEAHDVLESQGFVLPQDDDATIYGEFAAAFLELYYFSRHLLAHTFPAIEDHEAVARLVNLDLNGPAILSATRPAGAPEPDEGVGGRFEGPHPGDSIDPIPSEVHDAEPDEHASTDLHHHDPKIVRLGRKAALAAQRGNDVRAAILHAKAARILGPEAAGAQRARARAALKQLAERLQKALFIRKGEAEHWAEALTPLLRRASRGFWMPEARLLYDLQKVCVDHEREVFRLDTIRWLFSFGRRPLKKPLPHLREVMMSKHLRTATHRLPQLALTREDRNRLAGLLAPAVHKAEVNLRDQFRPWIDATLKENWVAPSNVPERVAYRRLVEELLDQVVANGFTTLGDLRDAASRSQLKMPDLSGPRELVLGDRLLLTDQALARSLEGVHHSGEIYMRLLQRLSALAFGTKAGRFLTLFGALPFGGAFVALFGIEEIDHVFVSRITGLEHHFVNWWSVFLLGVVALATINFPRFRYRFLAAFRALGWVFRLTFLDMPSWVLRNPHLRRIVGSRPFILLWQWLAKPMLLAVPAALITRGFKGDGNTALGVGCGVFILSDVLFNTRAGRRLEQLLVDRLDEAGRGFVLDFIPGAVRAVMWAFERVLEWVERLIYAVDEWLRFKSGQSGSALAGKAVLGLAWGVVAYLVRFYVNLLIEPQINPIKHFPVVTVSHKVMLPFLTKLTRRVESVLVPVFGAYLGFALAWVNVLLIPGIFGFLVWELKSNWRLYAANRSRTLQPEIVGSHGETVVRLLRPGFHSGTLPKLFARLRRAESEQGHETAALKRRDALHHVEESLRRFIERDLVALLDESRRLAGTAIHPGFIHLATNRIRFELLAAEDREPVLMDLVEHDRILMASLAWPGWVERLPTGERRALNDALVGFFKMSGVQVFLKNLDDGTTDYLPARSAPLARFGPGDAMNTTVVSWRDWVALWEGDGSGRDDRQEAWRLVEVLDPSDRGVPAREISGAG